jgi:hypothetical protein
MATEQGSETRLVTLSPSPAPEWKRAMEERYARTGTVRQEDISRVLGDQTRAVHLGGPGDNTSSFYKPS